MTRKKSNRDSRGYSNTETIHVHSRDPSVAGISKQKVEVSKAAQDELSCLLDRLKLDLQWGKYHSQERKDPIIFSVKDKKMVNKISKLNDQLVTLGFNREQIIKGIVAILSGESGTYFDSGVQTSVASNESLSLETLLDWFCIHLITEELPRLFVPVKGQEAGGEGDKTPVIVLPRESTTDKSVEMTTTSARAPPQLIEMFLQTF